MTRKMIGRKIRNMRKAAKINQQQMAEMLDIGVKTVVNVEKGRNNVLYGTIKAMLDVFGMTMTIVPKSEAQLNAEMFGDDEFDDEKLTELEPGILDNLEEDEPKNLDENESKN